MTQILTIIIVALACSIVGYLLGKKKAENKFTQKNEESLRGSRSGIKGRISEQMAPYISGFPEDLKASEARFIGSPIDFVVFKGMNDGNIEEVVFVEVKSGEHPRLNPIQKKLEDFINTEKKARWYKYKVPENMAEPENSTPTD